MDGITSVMGASILSKIIENMQQEIIKGFKYLIQEKYDNVMNAKSMEEFNRICGK